ncbi:hypothetical protein PR003_g23096 [Phytophthora rubi]|uniref:Uncharacterized protein n=1 Tax=Phytophthora rubi TaxID=129364 RepID=A0A6A3HXL0_9STRA|nr:hypothetical protein PR002_g26094 [Phytophthora rubi]KAE8980981.1 hypothetical protein PR001_g24132 [Phytophthora rubi]KAE9299053.1 hypothetical protein PR003_g23096 [Phytophthora rubi]
MWHTFCVCVCLGWLCVFTILSERGCRGNPYLTNSCSIALAMTPSSSFSDW